MQVKLISITKPEIRVEKDGQPLELSPEELIVYVARVSSPKNQNNIDTSEKLLNYLIKHSHWSPFEMVDMTLEIVTSRAIAQQILRHRSFSFQEFCITGDSIITLQLPSGATFKRSIGHLYKLQSNPNQYVKKNGLPLARTFNGKEFTSSRIREVFKTGLKPVFRVTLADGKKIECSKEHKFLSQEGFLPLEEIVGLTKSNNTWIMSKGAFVATNGTPVYQSYDWMKDAKERSISSGIGLQQIASEAGISYHTARRWLKRLNLSFTKKEVSSYTSPWNKGKFGYSWGKHSLSTLDKMKLKAKRGVESNLWRGGSSRTERLKIADWCNSIRARKLKGYNYSCNYCSSSSKLELDHIQSVASRPDLSYSYENIQVLCETCHDKKHGLSGEAKVWRASHKGNTLTVKWTKIEKIEFVGEKETFDLEVESDSHNYIANGIVVHNSQRYAEVTDFEPVQLRKQAETNRQSSTEVFDPVIETVLYDGTYHEVLASTEIANLVEDANKLYKRLVAAGVAKECARMVLPLTTQTRIYMKGSIRSWVHWLDVRLPENTQLEHREIAQAALAIFKENFPTLYKAKYERTKYDPDFTSKAPEFIRQLREKTGAGLFDCRGAVEMYGLDEEKCIKHIRSIGLV